MFRRTCCAVMMIASFAVFAEETNFLRLKPELQRGDIYKPQGWWPMLGVGFGTMNSTDTRTGGYPGHIKMLGSYYFEENPIVFDGGVGLHNEFLTQSGQGSDTIQTLYTEFAGRYVMSNRWQAGAIWNTLFDNAQRYKSNSGNLASFIGAQVLKEFTWNDAYLVRVGGRATSSVGLRGGSVNALMAELEVSFGGPKSTSVVVQEPVRAAPVAPHLAAQAVRTFDLDPRHVHFSSSSTHLVKGSDAYINRLARALANNHQLFDRVEVIGHADQRGSDKFNTKLSERRAKTISDKLIAAGVKSSQIKVEGRGKKELLSQSMKPSALQLNRRVQLEFQGVKNQEALKNVIDSVSR